MIPSAFRPPDVCIFHATVTNRAVSTRFQAVYLPPSLSGAHWTRHNCQKRSVNVTDFTLCVLDSPRSPSQETGQCPRVSGSDPGDDRQTGQRSVRWTL